MAGSVASEDGDMGFQIAPMVDVVFVLLLFFMAAAGSQIIEKELPVHLPGPSAPGPSVRPTIVIQITPDGMVTVNDRTYGTASDRELAELKTWFKATIQTYGEDPVILRPSPDTRQARVIEVLDACVAGGVKKLSFG